MLHSHMARTIEESMSRRKCPTTFTSDVVLQCCRDSSSELADMIARCRGSISELLFKVDYEKGKDKEALHKYRGLLSRLLLANPTGIFKKLVLQGGLKKWDVDLGGLLTRTPDRLRSETYAIVHLMATLKDIKKSMTNGTRLPAYLKDLVSLFHFEGSDSEDDDEDETKDGSPTPLESSANSLVPYIPVCPAEPEKADLSKLRAAAPKRRLLKRITSTTTPQETGTESSDEAEGECSEVEETKPTEKAAASSTGPAPVYWYSSSSQEAYKQEGGKTLTATCFEDSMGVKLFTFNDGTTWLSEEPSLLHEPTPLKRPAAAQSKRKADGAKQFKSDPWKLAHSRAYHGAKREYLKKCKSRGKEVDPEESKAFIGKKIIEAQAEFFC